MIIPRKIISGSPEYLPYAESKLREMVSIAQKSSAKSSRIVERLPNGGLMILTVGLPNILEIVLTPGGVDFLSGMVSPGFLENHPIAGSSVERKTAVSFYPGSAQDSIDHKGRAARFEPKLGIPPTVENARSSTIMHLFAQTGDVSPCMYSGTMVRIAQLALGLNKADVEYQHSFECTHGIYMDGATPWLIEISAARGVLAKKLSGSKRAATKALDTLLQAYFPMVPDGKAFPFDIPKAIAAGTVRQLISGGGLVDFYANNPYFADCGWAFSDSGNKAVNTCWSWPDSWKRGKMFTITIGGEPGEGPTVATIAKNAEQYLYNPEYYHGNPNSKLYFPTGNGNDVATFGMTKAGTTQTPPPGLETSSWVTPVYAFYVGEDLKVYNSQMFYGLSPAVIGGWSPRDPNVVAGVSNFSSQFHGLFPTDVDDYDLDFIDTLGVDQQNIIDFSGPGIDPPVRSIGSTKTTIRFSSRYHGALYLENYPAGYAFQFRVIEGMRLGEYTQTDEVTASRIKGNSLTITPKNRCCVLIDTSDDTSAGSKTITHGITGLYAPEGASYSIYVEEGGGTGVDRYFPVVESGSFDAGGAIGQLTQVGFDVTGDYPSSPIDGTNGGVGYGGGLKTCCSAAFFQMSPSEPRTDVATGAIDMRPVNYTEPTINTPASSTGYFACLNHTHYNVDAFTLSPDLAALAILRVPSPDDGGNYAFVASGRSGFKDSHYHSKLPNTQDGTNLRTYLADGEVPATLTTHVSWVGLS